MKNSKYILAGMSAFCLVLITATSIKSSFLMPLRRVSVLFWYRCSQASTRLAQVSTMRLKIFLPAGGAGGEQNLQMRLDQMVEENNRLQSELYELDRLRELYQLDQEYMQYKK